MFNWFKRFQQPVETPDSVESTSPPSESSSEVAVPVSPEVNQENNSEATTPAADDYLAWAKAAYQNIQKQKEEVEEVEEVQGGTGRYREVQEVQEVLDIPEVQDVQDFSEVQEVQEVQNFQEEEAIASEAIPVVASEMIAVVPETISEAAVEVEVVEAFEPEAIVDSVDKVDFVDPISEVEHIEVEPLEETQPEILVVEVSEAPIETSTEIPTEIPVEPVAENLPEIPVAALGENPPETNPPLPFWARETEAERLTRLESLVVEAEIPEVITATPASISPVPISEGRERPGSDLVFDEGFLWSAQVLAAQGRRPEDVSVEEISWLKRLRQGLEKTRLSLINQLKSIVGKGPLDKDAVEAIESLLLQADVGVEATDYIITTLQAKLKEEVLPPDQAIAYLKQILRDLLDKPYQDNYTATFVPDKDTLNIWLMTGVNGAGKTTTVGKLAHLAQKSGYSCLIGAADTFRAAAVEQVKIWGQRSGTEVIANPGQNTDPGSVVFDAITAAQARNIELLLIDTAGRLQNKKNLMDELGKIRRIVDKKAPQARVESLLVLDATLGQNGLVQAQVFAEAAKLSGVVLTKLDGTAKGGVALAVVQQLGLPIRFIGAGEGIEDLRPFSSYEFVEALLNG